MMTMVSFGDLAQNFLLKAQSSRLKAESLRITQELSSGQRADIGRALSGDHARLSAISRSYDLAKGFLSVTAEADFRMSSVQSIISITIDSGRSLVSDLSLVPQDGSPVTLGLATERARQTLDSILAAMNAAPGGRSVLAGDAVTGAAISSADVLLSALRPVIGAATTPKEAMDLAALWFEDAAGFSGTVYLGGAALADLSISENQKIWLGPKADDVAFRTALSGIAVAALLQDGVLLLDEQGRRQLAVMAGDKTRTGLDALADLGGRVGQSQAKIDATRSRLQAELLTLDIARSDLVSSDPGQLATELEAVQTNLETLYAVTARLSRLTLTDFLR